MNGHATPTECAFVDTWLDDWAARQVPDAAARRIEAHLARCERCRKLAAIVRGDEEATETLPGDSALVTSVLQHTTGSPCERAEGLLPAFADGDIGADDRSVLASHLTHCESCRQLLAALREANAVLPALAEMQPPPGFAEGVLRATRATRPTLAGAARWQRSPALAWAWFARVLARPRASLEIAYVATVLLVIVFGNPVAAFHGAEARANQLAASVPVARLSGDLPIKQAAEGTIASLLAPLGRAVNAVATEITARWRDARALVDAIAGAVERGVNWLATIDVKALVRAASDALAPRGRPQSQPTAGAPARGGGR